MGSFLFVPVLRQMRCQYGMCWLGADRCPPPVISVVTQVFTRTILIGQWVIQVFLLYFIKYYHPLNNLAKMKVYYLFQRQVFLPKIICLITCHLIERNLPLSGLLCCICTKKGLNSKVIAMVKFCSHCAHLYIRLHDTTHIHIYMITTGKRTK